MAQGFATQQTPAAAVDMQAKTVQVLRDMSLASGTQAVTGVGFEPKMVFLIATQTNVTQVASWGLTSSVFGAGAPIRAMYDNGYFIPGSWFAQGRLVRVRKNAGDTDNYRATLASFDSDGFTLDWVKTGSPTGSLTIITLCVR
jgi:hypothetical protein